MKTNRLSAAVFLLGLVLCAAAPATAAEPLLNAMFQDHVVLQRDKPIRIWGHATPGATVTLSIAQASVRAQADGTGRWQAALPAMEAGGPYTLTVNTDSGSSQTVNDVLVGDVWLCSGQSNMVLQVSRTLDSRSEIENSANSTIRMLTVGLNGSGVPLDAFPTPVKWQVAGPATVADFSAACFYFARELQKTVHVPMGLVTAASGGANITTWMSSEALHAVGGYDEDLELVKLHETDPKTATERWAAMWEVWWRAHSHTQAGSELWSASLDDSNWAVAPAGLGNWQNWNVPGLAGFAGQLWYRTTVTLTASQAAQDASLSLGAVNEEDETWVNGKPVGNMFGFGKVRTYELPAGTLHAGENSLVTNVLCTYRGCGLIGTAEKRALKFQDGTSVPLNGPWRYRIVPAGAGPAPRAPWGETAGLGIAYNAMIVPMGSFGFRGVVWYQGESNTGRPDNYRALLSALMADWRGRFGADLPFLIVQLPGYGLPPTKPAASDWALLREAQRQAVANDAHAALVVTIDIGEHTDIHPANKQEVGKRLARAARHLIYGNPIVPNGPTAARVRHDGRRIAVTFSDVESGLAAYGASTPIGFELCGPTQATCRYATAHIRASGVLLDVPAKFAPTHVRYCWADGPICTLFDGAGLPAAPFDLPLQPARGHARNRAPRVKPR
ncbi:MAG: beta galactosidase jelly roll domain-containing protein [Alphaproteobacteria bacterium]|nr:beta galactosidase jelly roll domain-containing protein [Alphaproteobacteria bacterium]MDE2630502.1 beta galactosidase jelly roll domain-containing protein [Alphaproteobacteria bacterium]